MCYRVILVYWSVKQAGDLFWCLRGATCVINRCVATFCPSAGMWHLEGLILCGSQGGEQLLSSMKKERWRCWSCLGSSEAAALL